MVFYYISMVFFWSRYWLSELGGGRGRIRSDYMLKKKKERPRLVSGGFWYFFCFYKISPCYHTTWLQFKAVSDWSAQNIAHFQVENQVKYLDYPQYLWQTKTCNPNSLNNNCTILWASDCVRLSRLITKLDSEKMIITPIFFTEHQVQLI